MVLAVLGSEATFNELATTAAQDNIVKLVLILYSIYGSNLKEDPLDPG